MYTNTFTFKFIENFISINRKNIFVYASVQLKFINFTPDNIKGHIDIYQNTDQPIHARVSNLDVLEKLSKSAIKSNIKILTITEGEINSTSFEYIRSFSDLIEIHLYNTEITPEIQDMFRVFLSTNRINLKQENSIKGNIHNVITRRISQENQQATPNTSAQIPYNRVGNEVGNEFKKAIDATPDADNKAKKIDLISKSLDIKTDRLIIMFNKHQKLIQKFFEDLLDYFLQGTEAAKTIITKKIIAFINKQNSNPLLLNGPPGTGKSSSINHAASMLGLYDLISVFYEIDSSCIEDVINSILDLLQTNSEFRRLFLALRRDYLFEIDLSKNKDPKSLEGHAEVYKGSIPGSVAQAFFSGVTFNTESYSYKIAEIIIDHIKNNKKSINKSDILSRLGQYFQGIKVIGIDEIDKAHIEMVNTLLSVLEPSSQFKDTWMNTIIPKENLFMITASNTTETIPEHLKSRLQILQFTAIANSDKSKTLQRKYAGEIEKINTSQQHAKVDKNIFDIIVIYFYSDKAGMREILSLGGDLLSAIREILENPNYNGPKTIDKNNIAEFIQKYLPSFAFIPISGNSFVGNIIGVLRNGDGSLSLTVINAASAPKTTQNCVYLAVNCTDHNGQNLYKATPDIEQSLQSVLSNIMHPSYSGPIKSFITTKTCTVLSEKSIQYQDIYMFMAVVAQAVISVIKGVKIKSDALLLAGLNNSARLVVASEMSSRLKMILNYFGNKYKIIILPKELEINNTVYKNLLKEIGSTANIIYCETLNECLDHLFETA